MTRVSMAFLVAGILTAGSMMAPVAQATLIPNSAGFVTITGNDAANASGSFVVEVAYQVYDGTSAGDPLGATNHAQLAFVLHHAGSDGEAPALAFGRFIVFAPSPASTTVPYYSALDVVNPGSAGAMLVGPSGNQLDPFGGVAPTSSNIDPPPTGANRGKFFFQTGLQEADFQPGQTSQLLVVSEAATGGLPADIVIELDSTNTVPSVHGDTIIHIVPEPSVAVLLALALPFLRQRRIAASI